MVRSPIAVVLAGAILATAACGAGASAQAVVAGAPGRTTGAKTAAISESLTITPNPQAAPNPVLNGQPLIGEGKVDFGARQGTLQFHVGQLGTVDAVFQGTTIYEKIPLLAQSTGKPWIKIDLDSLAQAAGIQGLGALAQSQGGDPTQGLQYLKGLTGTVATIGHDKVRGVNTTHYHVTADLNQAAAKLPPEEQATVKQITDLLGSTTIPIDVWIDDQGRVRRQHFVIDYTNAHPPPGIPATSLPKSIDTTIELYDFGTPVTVELPPADQVTDLASLLPGRQSSSSSSGQTSATTAADSAKAQSLVLQAGDYPAGWTTQPHQRTADEAAFNRQFASCLGLPDPASVQTADVDGPDANNGTAQVQTNATYTGTQAQADAEQAALRGSKAAPCIRSEVEQVLRAGGVQASGIAVTGLTENTGRLPYVGFRVSATAAGRTITVDIVQLFVRRAQPNITFSSEGGAIPVATEQPFVAELVAKAGAA